MAQKIQLYNMDDFIYILDACVFVKEGFLFEMEKIYVCPYSVIEEVKSPDAQIRLASIEKQKGIEFIQPKKEYIETVKKLEKKSYQKNKGKLSRTDIDIIAIALFLKKKNKKICVVTDDILIQKICKKNKIDYEPFFLLRKI